MRRNNDPSIDLTPEPPDPPVLRYCETDGAFYHDTQSKRTDSHRIAVGEMDWIGMPNDYSKGRGHYFLCANCISRFASMSANWKIVRW